MAGVGVIDDDFYIGDFSYEMSGYTDNRRQGTVRKAQSFARKGWSGLGSLLKGGMNTGIRGMSTGMRRQFGVVDDSPAGQAPNDAGHSTDKKDYYKITPEDAAPDQMYASFSTPDKNEAIAYADAWVNNHPTEAHKGIYLSHHEPGSGSKTVKHYPPTIVTLPVTPVVPATTATGPTTTATSPEATTTADYGAPQPTALDQLKTFMTAQAIPSVPNYIPITLVVGGAVAAVIAVVAMKKK